MRKYAFAALTIAALLLLGAASVRSALTNFYAATAPEKALAINAGDARALQAATLNSFVASNGQITSETLGLSRRLARAAPLDDFPVMLIGLGDYLGGDVASASTAMRAALDRNPRSRIPRLFFIERSYVTGNFATAVAEIGGLLKIQPEAEVHALPVLEQMASQPAGQAALVEGIVDDPIWASPLLMSLNASSPDIGFLTRLNAARPSHVGLLLRRLVDAGELTSAYLIWLEVTPDLGDGGTPFNPRFEPLDAAVPFNWMVNSDHAEIERGGGLYSVYLGYDNPFMARQVMLLSPGRYRLEAMMSVDADPRGGQFGWIVRCLPSGAVFLREKIDATVSEMVAREVIFDVPREACEFQELMFVGMPGEAPRVAYSRATEVRVRPVLANPDADAGGR